MTKKKPDIDTLLPTGTCPDDPNSVHVVGMKDGAPVVVGHGHRIQEGKPLLPGSDVYYLDPETGRVDSHVTIPHNGPAQVATKTYRENYDAIFGKKATKTKGLN